MFKYIHLIASVAILATATPSLANTIVVKKAWAEAMDAGSDHADMFFTIENAGGADDRLYAVKAGIADNAILQGNAESEVAAGNEKAIMGLLIPAGETVEFSEDGPHVELEEVKKVLAEGDAFPVMLFFEQAGRVKVNVTVGEGHHH